MPELFPRRRAAKLRHPDIVAARWCEHVLGDDDHGTWTVQPAGEPTFFAGGDRFILSGDMLRCYAADGRWVAQFWERDRVRRVQRADGTVYERVVELFDYIDMSRPGSCGEAEVSFVDLVLDVERRPGGAVLVLDEDEVADEMERYGIPADDIAVARATCAEVFAAVSSGVEPFDGAPWAWHEKYRAVTPLP